MSKDSKQDEYICDDRFDLIKFSNKIDAMSQKEKEEFLKLVHANKVDFSEFYIESWARFISRFFNARNRGLNKTTGKLNHI